MRTWGTSDRSRVAVVLALTDLEKDSPWSLDGLQSVMEGYRITTSIKYSAVRYTS